MRRGVGAALALVGMLAAGPAGAIVGGAADSGPLARSSVMVLSSKGGVCSAVVLDRDVVLTAAHCVTGAPEHRVHYKGADGSPELIVPAAKAVHPGYDPKAVKERRRSIDLALLRLPGPLPASFERATLSGAGAGSGSTVTVGGFGLSAEGDPRTSGAFRTAALTVIEPYGRSTILVFAKGPGGACQGDSGGPMAQGAGVFALATWATGEGSKSCGALTQGTILGPQRDWIDRTLGAWGRGARWE